MAESEQDKKQINLTKKNYIFTLLIALLIGAAGMYGANYFLSGNTAGSGDVVLGNDSDQTEDYLLPETEDFASITKMFAVLKNSYYEEVDSDILIEGALDGMTKSIDDPYTEYLNEEEASNLEDDISGSFQGIGAEVMKEGEYVRIISPIANSPAEEAGMQPNDLVVEVEGESVAELTINEAVSLIRGPEGSEVTLLIQRGEQRFTLTLTRDTIPVETVFYEVDEENSSIGYVNIVNFNAPTYDETVEAIQSLEAEGVSKIIFDVRGNPGGLLNIALQVSNIFVPNGEPLAMTEYRDDEEPTIFEASEEYGDFKYTEDAVLLIDEGSASASEILAGAMQSVDIPIYGQASFGKGTIQSILELSPTEEVKFTAGKWLTADGNWINEEGIQPDVEVGLPEYAKLFVVNTSDSFTLGEVSPEGINLKEVLKALGYNVSDTTVYDESVESALKDFQKENELEVDGQVTPETARALTDSLREQIENNDTQYKEAIKSLQ